jgi:hypothetical protein
VSRLAKSDAFASAVLFDEFDASSFKSMPYRRFVRERNWNFPINNPMTVFIWHWPSGARHRSSLPMID